MQFLPLSTILLAIVAQLAAAAIALTRLRAASRFRLAWVGISAALLLMVSRRALEFWHVYSGDQVDWLNAMTGLAISILMLYGVYGLRQLFDHMRKQEIELERQAHLDFLTGLRNRRAFFEQGELELSRAARQGTPLSVLILDIDLFKQVNDRYGHEVGDQALKALAAVSERTVRRIDILGRLGGEEFAVLLPGAAATAALEAAERLRQAIADEPIELDTGTTLAITVSIGVATLARMAPDTPLGDLLRRADVALYSAKSAGRNCVCPAEPSGPSQVAPQAMQRAVG